MSHRTMPFIAQERDPVGPSGRVTGAVALCVDHACRASSRWAPLVTCHAPPRVFTSQRAVAWSDAVRLTCADHREDPGGWARALRISPEDVALVRSRAEYDAAARTDRHAAFIGIQGGNALDHAALALIPDDLVVRSTLVHLSTSAIGTTSSPLARLSKHGGLTAVGKDYLRRLNERRIFVDLAHINREGFFDAVAIQDKTQPLMVSHTGVAGVRPHWRNVDDAQLRAVAATGGVIGVIYEQSFLAPSFGCTAAAVVDHLAHIIQVAGEDAPALGSDWDGLIVPPRDLRTCLELPRLVQIMLERAFSPTAIQKVLGGNFLRALAQLRP